MPQMQIKCYNYKLIHRDNISNVKDGSIDFIYSFIVFQHFDTFDEVKFYLDFIKRVLKDDGVAHIFFGKSKDEVTKEISPKNFKKRACSLFINPEFFYSYIKEYGFELIESEVNMKKNIDMPEGPNNVSGQARVLFKK